MDKSVLLLSSSKAGNSDYMTPNLQAIQSFLLDSVKSPGNCSSNRFDLLFIPYAAVTLNYDTYHKNVADVLNRIDVTINSIHQFDDLKGQIEKANGFMVGGGNTFELLKQLYDRDLIALIQEKVAKGTPYIGWSAGSNIAGPSIATTNDMPIVQPPSFNSLNLLPWHINPHYTEQTIMGHNGESRQARIEEFLSLNPNSQVIALAEGTGLSLNKGKLSYFGEDKAYFYCRAPSNKLEKHTIDKNTDINKLLHKG